MVDYIFSYGTIITMDNERRVLKNSSVVVDEYNWRENRKTDNELFDIDWQRRDGGHY